MKKASPYNLGPLQAARKRKHLSYAKLAQRLNYDPTFIFFMLNGQRVSAPAIERIALELDVPIEKVLKTA